MTDTRIQDPTSDTSFRMLIVSSDTYPPARVDVTVLFGQELVNRGHGFDWLLQSEADCDKAYKTQWGGGTAWVGPTDLGSSLFSRIRKHIRGIWHDFKLLSLAKETEYDFIEVKDKFLSGLLAVWATRSSRTKFIYWLSYPFPEAYLTAAKDGTARYPILYRIRGGVFYFLLYRVLLPRADHVFVQSEQMREDVAQEGIAREKMTPVPMGVALDRFDTTTDSTRQLIPEGERCFLYLGTLTKVRRLDFVIRVLAAVRSKVPGAKLYLVGQGDDPSDEQLLEAEARALGVLDSVVFTGQKPQAEAWRFVAEADVCVSPFYPIPILNSTSPTKLVEYMAMGKAVVANDHPEQRRVIEESGGGICVAWDEAEFAAAISELLLAPETAAEMGARGQAYVKERRTYTAIADVVERKLASLRTNP